MSTIEEMAADLPKQYAPVPYVVDLAALQIQCWLQLGRQFSDIGEAMRELCRVGYTATDLKMFELYYRAAQARVRR